MKSCIRAWIKYGWVIPCCAINSRATISGSSCSLNGTGTLPPLSSSMLIWITIGFWLEPFEVARVSMFLLCRSSLTCFGCCGGCWRPWDAMFLSCCWCWWWCCCCCVCVWVVVDIGWRGIGDRPGGALLPGNWGLGGLAALPAIWDIAFWNNPGGGRVSGARANNLAPRPRRTFSSITTGGDLLFDEVSLDLLPEALYTRFCCASTSSGCCCLFRAGGVSLCVVGCGVC